MTVARPAFKRPLHRHLDGHDVIALQRALHKAGVRSGDPSGDFRLPTAKQVIAYKHKFDLPNDDGVVRQGMWDDLIHHRFFDGYDVWLIKNEPKPEPPIAEGRLLARACAAHAYALRDLIGYIQQRPMEDMAPYPPNLDTMADCSEFWKWCRRSGGMSAGDDLGWAYGNTQSLKEHGRLVSLSEARIADAVFYGTGSSSDPFHMALYAGAGAVYSHGSSAAPFYLPAGYRTIRQIRTYEPA